MASRNPVSAGSIIALSIFTGTAIGTTQGTPSLGCVLGTGVGFAIALVVWLVDRARLAVRPERRDLVP